VLDIIAPVSPLLFHPVSLGRSLPFSNPDFLYEIKYDGFRSMVHIENGRCRLVSRNGNEFETFSVLNNAIATEIKTSSVIDGEIVCLDESGKPQFRDLLFHRGEPRFMAFDILSCNGEDLRYLPLIDRKLRLRSILPRCSDRIIYCDHVEYEGKGLFLLACKHDLEGIVAKPKRNPYRQDHAGWLKIRNQGYTQWAGREKLFERERETIPAIHYWDMCTAACVTVSQSEAS
jgi:bifunctional non-homologous end joining protein LigD